MRRCQALVAQRSSGSLPGRCYQTRSVHLVRWAPTPLRTRVFHLCTTHRGVLEKRGDIQVAS